MAGRRRRSSPTGSASERFVRGVVFVEWVELVELILDVQILRARDGPSNEVVSSSFQDALHDGLSLCERLIRPLDVERLTVAAEGELVRARRGIDAIE